MQDIAQPRGLAAGRKKKAARGRTSKGHEERREERDMKTRAGLFLGVAAIALAAFLVGPPGHLSAQQTAAVSVGDNDLGGVVTSAKGPEAGVRVIAETHDLPTR